MSPTALPAVPTKSLPKQLSTERLEIKPVSVEWLDEIFAENKGNVKEYFVKFAIKSDAQTWINENRRMFERGEKMEMVVLDSSSKEFLGMVSLQRIKIAPEFGVWIKEGAQGKGYGKEAVKTVLDWYKLTFGMEEKVRYLVESGNMTSVKLARALQMEQKGQLTNEEGRVFDEFSV